MEDNAVRLEEARAEKAMDLLLNKPKKTKSALERAEDARMVLLLTVCPPLFPSRKCPNHVLGLY